MLHCTKTRRGSALVAVYACSVTASLVFVAVVDRVSAQTEGSASFERRFFFSESPTASEPPRQTAPTSSEHKTESQGAHPAPSSIHSLITSPAQAAPAPAPESPTPTQPPESTSSRTAPMSSERNAESQEAQPALSSIYSAEAAPAPAPGRKRKAGLAASTKRVSQGVRPLGGGRAAWYQHPGRTASGEKFDPDRLTAAHKTLPFGTRLRVVNVQNGRAVVVRVNDRIPQKTKHITIDLSRASARAIGISGIGRVALYQLHGSGETFGGRPGIGRLPRHLPGVHPEPDNQWLF
jgi:rare lipoprotein A